MRNERWAALAVALLLGLVAAIPAPAQNQNNAYLTTVDEYDDDVFHLGNDAVVEKTSFGFVGFVGFNKEALLYPTTRGANLWVEGKGLYEVEVLKGPDSEPDTRVALVDVSEVRGDGEFLELSSGDLLEVDPIETITTSLWLAPFRALFIYDGRLLNLDQPSDGMVNIVGVR